MNILWGFFSVKIKLRGVDRHVSTTKSSYLFPLTVQKGGKIMNNMYYPYYNPMLLQDLQNIRDRVDKQMLQMQQSPQQPFQQPQINQTFQLANNQIGDLDSKYASSIEEVKNTLAIKTTLFVDKDMKNLWVKDVSGSIKSYTLEEIIEIDEKDREIIELKKQIEDLKGAMSDGKRSRNNDDEYVRSRNPQMFQAINQARTSGADPQALLKQMIGNANSQQIESVMQQAKQLGVPDDVLSQMQNFKK